MTHLKVDIQLPLNFNAEKGKKIRETVPKEHFFDTYEELLKIAGGINTHNVAIMGSWVDRKTKKRYDDNSTVFSVLVDSEDKFTIQNVSKIKELKDYKEKLKER